jgi:two-component system sensor histidine kinase HydH
MFPVYWRIRRRIGMKIPVRTLSWIAAALIWFLLSVLMVFILLMTRDRARLIRDNENERLFNTLIGSFRTYGDFDSLITSNPVFRDRIIGFAIYGRDLLPVYAWGKVPPVFDEGQLERDGPPRNERFTVPNRGERSVYFILRAERMGFPPVEPPELPVPQDSAGFRLMARPRREPAADLAPQDLLFFNSALNGRYIYLDISHPAYWRTMTVTAALFPVGGLLLLVLVFYIRSLYMRNAEYRDRIEGQKNLVVLGTAAGTLAHEIKNPLLSIRLQTGILGKVLPGTGKEELRIIDEEVDRLSALVYRVNDYLRDAAGDPVPVNGYDLMAETSRRLCGRDITAAGSCRDGIIRMDPERARSVFENIIRNALESGSPEQEIGASITRSGGRGVVVIDVFDRGTGIPPTDLKRVFDPFFTSKSTGTGIGLSISKRFVEAAGGTIVPENREGGGTLIRLTFPETPGRETPQ